jgi:WD40 repeat protein
MSLRFGGLLLVAIFLIMPTVQAQDLSFNHVKTLGGRGTPIDVSWSPNGETIAISSGVSVWLYDSQLHDVRPLELAQVDGLDIFESLSGGQLAWSPDGTKLAAGSGFFVQSVRGQFAYMWDVTTGDIVHTFGKTSDLVDDEAPREVAWSSDGDRMAGFSRTEFWVWDAETGDVLLNERHEITLFSDFEWTNDNTLQVLDTINLQQVSWDAETGEFINAINVGDSEGLVPVVSPDGILEARPDTQNAQVVIVERDSREELRTFEIFSEQRFLPIRTLWSADSSVLVTYITNRQPEIRIYDLETGDALFEITYPASARIEALDLNPDNKTLAVSLVPGIIEAWDIQSQQLINKRWSSVGVISDISWSPDGSRIVNSSSNDSTVRIWDVENETPLMALTGHDGWTFSAAWSPDGATIATGDAASSLAFPSTLRLWEADTGELISVTPIESDVDDFGFIQELEWSPDGTMILAIRDSNNTGKTFVRVYDVENNQELFALDPERARIIPALWAPDSSTFVGGVTSMGIPLLLDDGTRTDSALMRFDASSGELVEEMPTDELTVSMDWNLERNLIVNAQSGRENVLSFRDGATGEHLFETEPQPQRFTETAWQPGGELLAVGTFLSLVEPIVEIWRVSDDSAVKISELSGHLSFGTGVTALEWSADGRFLATAADDGKIMVWEVEGE